MFFCWGDMIQSAIPRLAIWQDKGLTLISPVWDSTAGWRVPVPLQSPPRAKRVCQNAGTSKLVAPNWWFSLWVPFQPRQKLGIVNTHPSDAQWISWETRAPFFGWFSFYWGTLPNKKGKRAPLGNRDSQLPFGYSKTPKKYPVVINSF